MVSAYDFDAELSGDLLDKVNVYLKTTFGPGQANQILSKYTSQRLLFKFLLTNMIHRHYRYPERSFMLFDFKGHGYVTAENIYSSKLVWRLPMEKHLLKTFLLSATVFNKQEKLNIQDYTKYFYPNLAEHYSEVDS